MAPRDFEVEVAEEVWALQPSSIIASSVTDFASLAAELLLLLACVSCFVVCVLVDAAYPSSRLPAPSSTSAGLVDPESLSELSSCTACWNFLVPCFQKVPAVFRKLLPNSAASCAGSFSLPDSDLC